VLGHSHALSAAAAGLGAGILLHWSAPADFALSGFAAGFGTFPDLDKCGSGPARVLGPVTEGLAWGIGKASGGHRHLTHTCWGAAIFTGLALAACYFRHDLAGKIGLMLLLTVGFSAGLWGLHIAKGLRGDLLGLAGAAAVTFLGIGLSLVALSVAIGVLAHDAGDGCTVSGVRWFWPLSGHRFHLLPRFMQFTTGTKPELLIVDPLLLVALGALALTAVDPAAWGLLTAHL
jgi:membrane-bound metal-dependent hydrolase YbcI (DUF457 family)